MFMIGFALSNVIRGKMILPEVQEKKKRDRQKSLTFDALVNDLRGYIATFPDWRTGDNTKYTIEDIALGAFSIFYTQNPSFLAHQKAMQKKKGQNNARTLFGMNQVPCDNHIRNQLDSVSANHLFPLFDSVVRRLDHWGHLDFFRSYSNNLLLALDGTQYFASKKIHLENCSVKEHKNGTKTYFHTVITPVFVAPGKEQVISLTSATGEIIYKNAFATNFTISKNNWKDIIADGRARWKIENENNNILKTKGYHVKHNFGHGKEHLSSVLLTMNLLAFLFHTVFELNDELYKLIRDDLPSRKTFFDDLRALTALTKYMCFENWYALLIFMAKGLELEIPDTS